MNNQDNKVAQKENKSLQKMNLKTWKNMTYDRIHDCSSEKLQRDAR